MAVNVRWKDEAWEQYQALPAHLKQAARQIIADIQANPSAGWPQGTGTSHEGTPVRIRTFPGLLVEVQYYRWGFFRRNLIIYISSVQPMDWPGWDDYEERTRR